MLSLEWANYIFTTAFIMVRMFKLILVAVSSIGRIDRRLLAPGVGQIGPLELDPYPTIHTRDLVMHDAHRHPYIETLGLMYLMKLRYADDFGDRAGSAWRLVFVYALMPWMHRYRIRDDGNNNNDNNGDDDVDQRADFRDSLRVDPSPPNPVSSKIGPRASLFHLSQPATRPSLVMLSKPAFRPSMYVNNPGLDAMDGFDYDDDEGDDEGDDKVSRTAPTQAMRKMEAENARLREKVEELETRLAASGNNDLTTRTSISASAAARSVTMDDQAD